MSEISQIVLLFVMGLLMGIALGVALVRYGFGLGVRIVDRIQHDQEPFEDGFTEEAVQTNTDGTYEDVT